MFEASADRLSVTSPQPVLPGWQRIRRGVVGVALSGAAVWLLSHLLSISATGPDETLAVARIAGLVLLAGLGFVALLALEVLGGRADADEDPETAVLPPSRTGGRRAPARIARQWSRSAPASESASATR